MPAQRHRSRWAPNRHGVVIAEFAWCFPVFAIIMFGIFEFGRAYMVTQILNSAARQAARMGVTDDITSEMVLDKMKEVLERGGIAPHKVRFYIMDGSGFDENPNDPPSLSSMMENYSEPFEINGARARQLAIIRLECDFQDIRLVTPKWLGNVTLYGQVIVRKE